MGGEPTRGSVRHAATPRREHVLPRELVASRADHADLVAVVDDGRAAEQKEQRVREEVAPEQRRARLPERCRRSSPTRPMSWFPTKVGGVYVTPSARWK